MERYARLFQLIVPFAQAQEAADAAFAELQKEFPEVTADRARQILALADVNKKPALRVVKPLSQAEAAQGIQKLRGGKLTLRSRVREVLSDGRPRSPKEILDAIVARGYKATKNSNLSISQELSKHPEEFERIARGVYRLRTQKAEQSIRRVAKKVGKKTGKKGNGRRKKA